MNKKLAILTAGLLMAGTVAAQTTVKGRVTDKDGHPVAGAAVKAGDKVIALTDDNGNFNITKMPAGVKNLVFSFIGMESTTVSVSGNMSVVMAEANADLNEVIVIGYGTAKKQSFSGSVGQMKAKELEKLQVSNVSKAFEGNIAGVQTISSTGQPGSSASIFVRGIGSILASRQPLILVDGVPYEGSLNTINPNDIETMDVQKDASAASIFGARGANGIIMITTKKGKNAKTTIEFDAKVGWNSRGVQPYKTIKNEGTYYEMYWEAMRNRYLRMNEGATVDAANLYASQNLVTELGGYNSYNVADADLIDPLTGRLNPNASLVYHDDWLKDPFQNGLRQEYNLAMSGGDNKTNYYVSLNYLKDESYFKGSNFERFSARVNLEHQAYDWLRVGINSNYSNTQTNGTAGEGLAGNMFSFSQNIAPIYPLYVYDSAGNRVLDDNGSPILDYGNGSNWAGHNRPYSAGTNPLLQAWHNIYETKRDAINLRGFVRAQIIKDLSFTANVSMDNFGSYAVEYQTPIAGDALAVGGRGTKSSRRYNVINATQRFNYDRQFGDHNVSALLGHESKSDNNDYLAAQKTGFFIADNPQLDNAIKTQTASGYDNSYTLEGYFARLGYDYKSRYYVSGTYRRDGSSRFHPDHRWGNFASIGASWLMHKESWLQNTQGWLDILKLKASYGTQGNDNLGVSAVYLDQYTVSESNGEIAISQNFRGNPNLTWEKSKNFNIGFETSFWNGRLSADFDFFVKTTDDMLTAKPLPPSQGSPTTRYTNEMAMRNTGVELTLKGVILKTSKVRWNAQLNLTHYKNELTRLEEGKDPNGYQSGNYWRSKGGSLYDWYMKRYAGVDPQTGSALYYFDEEKPLLDENNAPVLDEQGNPKTHTVMSTTTVAEKATRYQIGKSSLPDVYGGLSTTVEGYGFDFSVSTAFSFGGWLYDSTYAGLMGSTTGNAMHVDVLKRWQNPGHETNVPKYDQGDMNMTGGSVNDRFLTRSDYFSIRNITLGYTLPKAWVASIAPQINNIRVYFVADNLHLSSKRAGLDPRQSVTGAVSSSNYSAMRTMSFGVNVKF